MTGGALGVLNCSGHSQLAVIKFPGLTAPQWTAPQCLSVIVLCLNGSLAGNYPSSSRSQVPVPATATLWRTLYSDSLTGGVHTGKPPTTKYPYDKMYVVASSHPDFIR